MGRSVAVGFGDPSAAGPQGSRWVSVFRATFCSSGTSEAKVNLLRPGSRLISVVMKE